MNFTQHHIINNTNKLSFEEVKEIIKSLPNPTGFNNRYYDDGILAKSNSLRRNQKGASQHSIRIMEVTDDKVKLLFKLADFKFTNLFFSGIILIMGLSASYYTEKLLIAIIFSVFALFIAYFAFTNDKNTSNWVNNELEIISSAINIKA